MAFFRIKNESPNVKIKWAVRLLIKLRKDIQNSYQNDLIDIIIEAARSNENNSSKCASAIIENKCVLTNSDMKGKMRRIDCLRQSDKVWRLDLVMIVLFKGIPLESSDGERVEKLPECKNPQLCINPNHVMLNIRDLEIFLANFIKNNDKSDGSLDFTEIDLKNNIFSTSVFSTDELLSYSNLTIGEECSS